MAATNDTTLTDYFARIYWPRKLGRSPRTATLYRLTIDRFGEWLGRTPTLADLTDDLLCGFLQSRLECRAAETVDKERDKLVAIANFAAKKKLIPEFVDVPCIKPAAKAPQCWRRDHLQMLFDACLSTPGRIGNAPASRWWYAFNAVALFTGERTGALLELRWEWLDGDVLRVPAEVRKGRHKPMTYRLPAFVTRAVERLRGASPDKIFATHWSRSQFSGSFYRHYTKLLERAGLPSGRKWKPQALRRTFGSWLEQAGGSATEAFGHSNRSITVASYLDVGITDAGKIGNGQLVADAIGLIL